MAASSSSQSRRKTRPVGPIEIDGDGCSFGPLYDTLSDHISQHVYLCDEFSPALTWPDHKNSGRVEALYHELTVSCVMFYWDFMFMFLLYWDFNLTDIVLYAGWFFTAHLEWHGKYFKEVQQVVQRQCQEEVERQQKSFPPSYFWSLTGVHRWCYCIAAGQSRQWDLDESLVDIWKEPVSYTHLTLPTIYSV